MEDPLAMVEVGGLDLTHDATANERLDTLVARHRALHQQVDELERHLYLTPSEQQQVTQLKKLRLAAKDRIAPRA